MPAQCPNIQRCPSERGLFSPIILKPDLWLDGADLSTIITRDNQTSVRQWNDKSGNGRNASQSNEAGQTTLVTNSLNGLSGLDWGSSANSKGLSTSSQLVAAQIFAVAKYDGANPFNYYASIYSGDPNYFRPIFTGASGSNWLSNVQNHLNGGPASATALPTISSPFIVRTANSNTSSATRTASYIGADSVFYESHSWIGKIYEIIIFPKILSDSDALMVEGSLAWKWGLYSFLTTSHPYRFAPPRDNRILTRKRRSLVLLAGASGVSTGNDSVTAQDVSLAWSCDSATIAQDHVVGVQDASLVFSSDTATVAQDHVVTAQDSSFALSSDAAIIAQDHTVTAQDSSFALSSDQATIAQDHVFTIPDVSFQFGSEAATLEAAGNDSVTAMDVAFAWASDAATISQDHFLNAQDVELFWESDASTLTQDHVLTAQDCLFQFTVGPTTVSSGGGGADPAAVWSYEIEPGYSAGDLLRLFAAVLLGKASGGPDQSVFRDINDTKDRVTTVATSVGDRTSVTYDPTI